MNTHNNKPSIFDLSAYPTRIYSVADAVALAEREPGAGVGLLWIQGEIRRVNRRVWL